MPAVATVPEEELGLPLTPLANTWKTLQAQVEDAHRRFLDELSTVSADAEALGREAAARVPDEGGGGPGDFQSLDTLLGQTADRAFLSIHASYLSRRPLRRLLSALEAHDRALQETALQLPISIACAPRDLIQATGRPRRWWSPAAWRSQPRRVALRAAVAQALLQDELDRIPAYDRLVSAIGRLLLTVAEPWNMSAQVGLARLSGEPDEGMPGARRWGQQLDEHRRRVDTILATIGRHLDTAGPRTARRATEGPNLAEDQRSRPNAAWLAARSAWSNHHETVTAYLGLHARLLKLARRGVAQIAESVASTRAETEALRSEHAAVVSWLEAWSPTRERAFPAPVAQLSSAEDRWSEWMATVSNAARRELPSEVEWPTARGRVLKRRSRRRSLHPLDQIVTTVETVGRDLALDGLREAERIHQNVVRNIERAREIVAYSGELVEAGEVRAHELTREAVENALGFLRSSQGLTPDAAGSVERGLVRALAETLLRSYVQIEHGRFGLLAHVTQRGWRGWLKALATTVHRGVRAVVAGVDAGVRRASRWVRIRLGWERTIRPQHPPVEERGYLESGTPTARRPPLPLLYQRLFRPEPVEDPRFLVGRGAELAVLGQALELWQAGKVVSVLVVGQRGSGKTSLLNCALVKVFSGVTVTRTALDRRLMTPEAVHDHLRDLLTLPPGADVRRALRETPRVLVVEEVERAFLRRVGGFHALTELLGVMADTSPSTLWIVALNLASFRLLDAACGMGQHFSHRINAMALEPHHIREAILRRHNLSGLNLHFGAPDGGDTLSTRLGRLVGLEDDRPGRFFDRLYEDSEGVFRAAFHRWRHLIDRIDGGILYLRWPDRSEPEGLRSTLRADDLFTLQAMLQHGSLEPEELAEVLGITAREGRERLELLVGREIIEPDPTGVGWRVRPEAGLLVHRVLDAENLM